MMAQNKFDYESKWKEIEKKEADGLLKTLLPIINEIYEHAKKGNNDQQLIKSLLYQSKISLITSDDIDDKVKIIQNFENELASSQGIEKSILQSMLAELYFNYYQQNQWQINERTDLQEDTGSDFRFWTENIFQQKISESYLKSLTDQKNLQNDPVQNWEYILNPAEENRDLRPTIYDLLAHRAIEYFQSEDNYYYGRNFDQKYEEEKNKNIQKILNDLIAFHKQKNNKEALLYNQLELLKSNRDIYSTDAYIDQLDQLSTQDPSVKYTAYVLYELAQSYYSKLNDEEEKAFANKKSWIEKSLTIIEKIQTNYPQSPVASQAASMKKMIQNPEFYIQIESYLPADKNNPMVVSHKNLDEVYFKIFRYSEKNSKLVNDFQYASDKDKQSKLDDLLQKLTLQDEFKIDLKRFDDYQSHSTIGKLNSLPKGQYLILTSNSPQLKVNSDQFLLQSALVNVSKYAIVFRMDEILVTERESGKIANGVKVEIYQQNNKEKKLIQTVTTNDLGIASYKLSENYAYNIVYKIQGEDVTYRNNYYAKNENQDGIYTHTELKFFTDRAIYRPGQTVYFKGILYESKSDNTKNVIQKQGVLVELKNPNGDAVSELELVTNEFGSFSGEFVLPTGGITGQYYLESNEGGYYFNVEEYKRPKFDVQFEDVKKTYKLDQEITAKGKAMAFSGANIDHAKVVYRVYRQAIYPYWPWWKRGYFPQNEPAEEITNGETTTDQQGNFDVKFQAKPALKTTSDKEPRTFTYRIVSDVTDINGETHTGEQSITVGDLPYLLDIPIDEKIEMTSLDSIPVLTQNLNNQFVPAKGKITVAKITPSDRILRESPLMQTDYELYPKSEFIKYFPHEPYANENLKENWKKETPILNETFDTDKDKSIKLNTKNWKEGYYVLKAIIPEGKDTVRTEKLVYLYRNEKKQVSDQEVLTVTLDKEEYKPGDTAKIQFSSATDAEILVQIELNGTLIKNEKVKLNNTIQTIQIPIVEKYRGNLFVNYFMGKFNTTRQESLTIQVPFEDTSLKITAATLRDKLLPGENETWELTVSGKGKDKFLAEMLATMYDASLDQFLSHSNDFAIGKAYHYAQYGNWITNNSYQITNFNSLIQTPWNYYSPDTYLAFDALNWFGFSWDGYAQYGYVNKMRTAAPVASINQVLNGQVAGLNIENADDAVLEESVVIRGAASLSDSVEYVKESSFISNNFIIEKKENNLNNVVARKALQETAFFYPHLKTDKDGNVKIQFTNPESLTQWKFMATAHTPDLRTGYFETLVRTQKDLMVVPNPPRFLREGDQITFTSKITNLSDKELYGQAKLLLFDAFTMQPIDDEFGNQTSIQKFSTKQGNSANLSWHLKIPQTHQAIVYRVVATAGDFSDGEESTLPILTNRMMVTETMPIHVREGQTKTFTLDKLKNNNSTSLDNFKLTFEMTTNPIWYAVFALPYLREYPYECSEQLFSRLYGNLISTHVINSNPKIKAVFDDWNAKGELTSKLEQNEELKYLLLEETPWVREAEDESQQMKRVAVLFDLNKMRNELQSAFQKLKSRQSSSGGFAWFNGGEENRYITTHIVSSIGHLQKMRIGSDEDLQIDLDEVLDGAIAYIDDEMKIEFERYEKNKNLNPSLYNGIQYLYARSYFLEDYPLDEKGKQIKTYFLDEFQHEMFKQDLQTQAMIALIFSRFDKKSDAEKLLHSIKDNSVDSDEMGMYWKSNVSGWYWYQAPIETQALLIEAFDEVLQDIESVESMKVWLLKNRQTNQWESTKATTEAVYALMNTGKDWTNSEEGIAVKIGNEKLDLNHLEKAPQSGTGYVKTSWDKEEIKPEMGTVEVSKSSAGVAWGAMYWQYFENLDKITSANTNVKFKKELFLKKNSESGPVLTKINENTPIKIGDLVTVRLEIQTDREMEFVHIKDMRASGFEPTNVISTYKRQGKLGYFESTRDAATNFFIDYMPKGNYVFEYDVRANNAGNFSNGITSLQNMYAPELSAHSEGIRVDIQ